MAIDSGGLDYTIAARDKFSAVTEKFRREMRASKASFRDFQDGIKVGRKSLKQLETLAKASKNVAAADRARAAATRKSTKVLTDAERQEKKFQATKQRVLDQRAIEPRLIDQNVRKVRGEARVLSGTERTLRRIRVTKARLLRQRKVELSLINSGIKQAKAERRELSATAEAQRRVAKAMRERAVAQAQVAQLRTAGRQDLITPALLKRAGQFQKETKRAAKNVSNIFFTLRRLVGILAVFTLARRLVQGFQDLVKLGLRFGDTLEKSRVSIAGILLATGQLRDEFGDTVEGAEALARAEGLASKQIRQLRNDALATTATFEQLLDTFQIAVGPGLAAGLNLDEIRQLSVSISQAATAIGLPQNQLAEEIRSLLSGTIQARTTRIATVLGISNADIKRLKESGELFDFLEERFSAFASSAEKQARSTLEGIKALVTGALGEVLGQAAEPLREELLGTLNQVLDDVLLVKDELGNVSPRPEVVASFRELFDALRLGVVRARELGQGLGFEGLQGLLSALGTGLVVGIEVLFGFVEGVLTVFEAIRAVVVSIAELFDLSNKELGKVAGILGTILASMFVWNNTAGLVGFSVKNILKTFVLIGRVLLGAVARGMSLLLANSGAIGTRLLAVAKSPIFLIAAGLGLILKSTELWFEKVLDVELGWKNVAELIGIGIIEAIDDAITLARVLGAELAGLTEDPEAAVKGAATKLGDIGLATLAGLGVGDAELALEQSLIEQSGVTDGLLRQETEREKKVRETKEQLLQELEARREMRRLAIEGIRTEAEARERNAASPDGANAASPDGSTADAFADAAEQSSKFFGTLSNANQFVRELAEDLINVQDELRTAGSEFDALKNTAGLEGVAGGLARIFTQGDIANAERLRKIGIEIETVQREITDLLKEGAVTEERLAEIQAARRVVDPALREEALEALKLSEAESRIVSLLRDRVDLGAAVTEAQKLQNELTSKQAAIFARQALPALREQRALMASTALAAERTNAVEQGKVGQRARELVIAQQALAVARQEEALAQQKREAELAFARETAANATGDEQLELQALVGTLEQRALLEDRIAAARLSQLQFAQQEAALISDGSFKDGLREGFDDVLEQLPTRFEQGVAIIKGSIAQLSSFISDSIIKAFDPTDDSSIKERFGRFLQSLAQLILSTIVQLIVATAIAKAFGVPLAGDTTPAPAVGGLAEGGPVPEGFAEGGKVGNRRARPTLAHFRPGVRGFSRGGRPRGLDPRDTIPAFLQPGEFVVKKSVVDSMGLGFFSAVNNGQLSPAATPAAAPAASTAASAGLASGGLVSDRVSSNPAVAQASQDGQQGSGTVVPAVVAKEREMDRLMNGGKAGFMGFVRENASDIKAILK